eukprot:1060217-Rhodomonas_salina.1
MPLKAQQAGLEFEAWYCGGMLPTWTTAPSQALAVRHHLLKLSHADRGGCHLDPHHAAGPPGSDPIRPAAGSELELLSMAPDDHSNANRLDGH